MTADSTKYSLAREEIELLCERADDAEIEKSEANSRLANANRFNKNFVKSCK